jgi:hypothetical protein
VSLDFVAQRHDKWYSTPASAPVCQRLWILLHIDTTSVKRQREASPLVAPMTMFLDFDKGNSLCCHSAVPHGLTEASNSESNGHEQLHG